MLSLGPQQMDVPCGMVKFCMSGGWLPFPSNLPAAPPLLKAMPPARNLSKTAFSGVSGCTDANPREFQPKVPRERACTLRLPGKKEEGPETHETASHEGAAHLSDKVESNRDATNSAFCSSIREIRLQKLLKEYRLRRSAFEKNCLQRYAWFLDAATQKRRANDLSRMAVGAHDTDQKQRYRLPPAQATLGKGQEGDGAEPITSSGEESISRGAGEARRALLACGDGNVPFSESRLMRRAKGTGQRSFPYRQFHVHHFLPEPESKVGLLTHPTPAQFNKYPKARGVWFDPHRNLVRTCWKENGKARTMGFPVNKFGLEEARTLAVEYHYYKCPTDPLPDDLLSLVPRKPPHAYGWC